MVEKVQLTFQRYRDKDNKPTCAINFVTREVCHFHGAKRFGTVELCLFHSEQTLQRRDGVGSLIPKKNCPMWSEDHQPWYR